jgi:hypothetical protein
LRQKTDFQLNFSSKLFTNKRDQFGLAVVYCVDLQLDLPEGHEVTRWTTTKVDIVPGVEVHHLTTTPQCPAQVHQHPKAQRLTTQLTPYFPALIPPTRPPQSSPQRSNRSLSSYSPQLLTHPTSALSVVIFAYARSLTISANGVRDLFLPKRNASSACMTSRQRKSSMRFMLVCIRSGSGICGRCWGLRRTGL